jgi:two-component system, response regulator RegA
MCAEMARTRAVLVVDDDERFAQTLANALGRRGWTTRVAHDVAAALAAARSEPPDAAIVDLKLAAEDGLTLLEPLRRAHPQMRIIVLTGYASIATAVKAIKLGADDYLAKPVTASAVADALGRRGARTDSGGERAVAPEPMSPRRLEWEHIQRVLTENEGNVSATARTLRMHRRTLQRKLAKRPTQS